MSNDYYDINAQVSLLKIYHLFVVASYLLWSQVTKLITFTPISAGTLNYIRA